VNSYRLLKDFLLYLKKSSKIDNIKAKSLSNLGMFLDAKYLEEE